MDVAGGNGALLAAILKKYPQPNGILFDMPHVIERAREKALLPEARTKMVAGDFFQSVPAGADAFLLKHIIHDWDDPEARTILQNIRRAASPQSRLLIVEMTVPPANEPGYVKLLDLEMLAIPGGRERTEEEFRQLLASAGFQLNRVIPTQSPVVVIEATVSQH